MATIKETMIRMEAHEKECLVRYTDIQRQLEESKIKFVKLERMIFSIYPFILGAIAFAKYG